MADHTVPQTVEEVKDFLIQRLFGGLTTLAAIQSIADNAEESEIRRHGASLAIEKFRKAFE